MCMDSTQAVLSITKRTFMIDKMPSGAWMSDKTAEVINEHR